MELLRIHNLCKNYPQFQLKNVSFALEEGYIMGFIGRNGAGKTTTLKAMLNLVHPDGGSVEIMGKDFLENEFFCKQKIGVVFGGADYYPRERLKNIAAVVRRFYEDWDDALYETYLARFGLDPEKKVNELSSGMRVKFALTLALSHHAKLLILDEPTSGLDPVSRDDLLELFQTLIEDGEHSILFSTHITSDLEKCADYIVYIKDGALVENGEKDEVLNAYRIVKGSAEQLTPALEGKLVGVKKHAFGVSGLIKSADADAFFGFALEKPDIESIMIYTERE